MTDWDAHAATFDDEPDHGLRDPAIRAAWRALLSGVLPPARALVADLGCGTGSLARLLTDAGHRVIGLDSSASMLAHAAAKTPLLVRGDAAHPPLRPGSCDVVLARHVLWALPDPRTALGRWVRLLRPGGRLVLIEGRWSTGAGIGADECARLVRAHRPRVAVRRLTDPALWGREITDERYLLVGNESG